MSDISNRICLNCRHWQETLQFSGEKDNPICRIINKKTNPGDSCSHFEAKGSFDDLQNPDKHVDRQDIFKFK